jgi:imidazolonepropionase-like amidohydrolase
VTFGHFVRLPLVGAAPSIVSVSASSMGDAMRIENSRCFLFGLFLLVSFGPRVSPSASQTNDSAIVFRNVLIVPMDSERVLPNQTVVVKKGKIIAIDDVKKVTIPSDAVVIDGSGKYLLPGLADMHVHTDPSDFPLFLANGITTVREMNGSPDHLKWRAQLASGELLGPRLFVASTMIAGEKQRYRHVLVTSPDQAAKVVREFAEQKYDFIKVYDGLSRAAYDQIVETARAEKIPVVGHIPSAVGLEHVLESGQKSIEHTEQIEYAAAGFESPLSSQQSDAVATQIARANAWITPTLASQEVLCRQGTAWFDSLFDRPEMKFVDSSTLAWWSSMKREPGSAHSGKPDMGSRFFSSQMNLVKSLNGRHALILAGTDTPNALLVPGFSLYDELRNLHETGLTAFEVLQTATTNPAKFLGLLEESGTVETGKRADLVLVDGNPLQDLATLRAPVGVMLRGIWLPRSQLNELLNKKSRISR